MNNPHNFDFGDVNDFLFGALLDHFKDQHSMNDEQAYHRAMQTMGMESKASELSVVVKCNDCGKTGTLMEMMVHKSETGHLDTQSGIYETEGFGGGKNYETMSDEELKEYKQYIKDDIEMSDAHNTWTEGRKEIGKIEQVLRSRNVSNEGFNQGLYGHVDAKCKTCGIEFDSIPDMDDHYAMHSDHVSNLDDLDNDIPNSD